MEKKIKTLAPFGFVHGRFQVVHAEHVEYIAAAARQCLHLTVGVTQSQASLRGAEGAAAHRSDPRANPLSFEERSHMLEITLDELAVPSWEIVPFPIESDPRELHRHIPTTFIAYTTIRDSWNRTKIERLRGVGYVVEIIGDPRPPRITASQVRELMRTGDPGWRDFVSPAVSEYLETIRLPARLRSACEDS